MIITIITKRLNTRTVSARQPVLSDAMIHKVSCPHHNPSNPAKFMHSSSIQDLLQANQLSLKVLILESIQFMYVFIYYRRVSLIELPIVCMFTDESLSSKLFLTIV